MTATQLSGIVVIDKPKGMTSHDVVARVRRITGQRKAGHAGTLDPLATGVLVICLGQATRVAEYLTAGDKTYLGRVRLGMATDTYDAEGRITHQAETGGVTRELVVRELAGMVGPTEQIPPMYSAVKQQGTRLYQIARRGETVARKPRRIQVHLLRLVEWSPPELTIEIHCSKGTYVRSLVHELGQRLGCWGYLAGLTRLASGSFDHTQAVSLEALEDAFARGNGADLLRPLDAALDAFPPVTVTAEMVQRITLGQRVQLPSELAADVCRAYSPEGELVALLRHQTNDVWQPHKVFCKPVE